MRASPAMVVLYRQFLSWRTNWRGYVLVRLLEPMIFFYGVGLGFGNIIPSVNGTDYLSFLLPGSVCLACLFSALFEGTYNAYTRAYMQGTWPSFLATPARLWHILYGELLWSGLRTIFSTVLLVAAGLALGAKISLWGTIAALPILMLANVSMVCMGYMCMSYARGFEDFDFIWPLLATPMVVFSGVMIPVETFPSEIQFVAWVLPLTHALEIVRPLMLGVLAWQSLFFHTIVLVGVGGVCFAIAHARLKRKLQG